VATAITHACVGFLLAPLAPAAVPRVGLYAALVLLAVLPDVDFLGDALGIPYAHPLGHRGFTHSLVFAALAGVAAAALFRGRITAIAGAQWRLGVVFFVATASHGVLDALTNGGKGVGFFIPLSNERFFFPWRPLAVTPLELDRLTAADVAPILWSEFLWVWVPATVIAVAACRVRRCGNGLTARRREQS